MELIDSLVHGGISPERMILGTGCCAFPDTVTLTKHAMGCGVTGVLILPPFYYKGVGDEGLFRFFDRTIQEVGDSRLRIYLYHFPQMTGVPIRVPLVERLLKTYPSTICGMKDSSGDWRHMASLCQDLPGFRMYAGTERFLLDILEIGGAGCISATANVTCTLAHQVYQTWSSNENARELQDRLSRIRSIIENHPMIPALKFLMAHLTGDTDWHFVRPPHTPMPEGDRKKLLEALKPVSFLETLNGIL
jgi:4-hydroxy-tetrahydrodipicolinate synthase